MLHYHALKEYLNLCNKTNKSKFLKYVFSHTINCQLALIAFAIIGWAA